MLKIQKKRGFYDLVSRKSYEINQPLFATLHNHNCKNNCNYCYLKYAKDCTDYTCDTKNNIFEDDFKFIKLLKELKNSGIIELIFSGGEPLLINDFKSKYLIARKMGFSVQIITSGAYWTDELINLVSCHCAHVVLSINGSNSKIHDFIVGKDGNFNKLYWLFEKLKSNKVIMSINYLITKHNYFDVGSFYKKFNSSGVKINFSYSLSPYLDNPEKTKEIWLNKEQFFSVADQLNKIGYIDLSNKKADSLCNVGRVCVGIDENGKVWPCLGLRILAGSLHENSFSEIWNDSKILKDIRNIDAAEFFKSETCNYCNNICIGDNHTSNGSFFQNYEYSKVLGKWTDEFCTVNIKG